MSDEVRVFVVDDVLDEAEALAARLELTGYKVRVFTDSQKALAEVEAFKPHCVLLDIEMPGIDGIELSKRLRERSDGELVLIAVSGWGNEDVRFSKAMDSMDYYLRKPIDSELLRQLLPPIG